jgi:hypothetical protein
MCVAHFIIYLHLVHKHLVMWEENAIKNKEFGDYNPQATYVSNQGTY